MDELISKAPFAGYRVRKNDARFGNIVIPGYEVTDLKTGKPVRTGLEGRSYIWSWDETKEFLKQEYARQGLEW